MVHWSTQAITYQFLFLYRFTNLCLSLSHGLAVQTHWYDSTLSHWACKRLQLQAHVQGKDESNQSASATVYSKSIQNLFILIHSHWSDKLCWGMFLHVSRKFEAVSRKVVCVCICLTSEQYFWCKIHRLEIRSPGSLYIARFCVSFC